MPQTAVLVGSPENLQFPHLVISNDFREHVSNRGRIVPRLYRMIDRSKADLVACTQPRHCFSDFAFVLRYFLIEPALSNTCP